MLADYQKQLAVERLWNRTNIVNQKRLIQRFVKAYGRAQVRKDKWLSFLAEEFLIDHLPPQQPHRLPSFKHTRLPAH
ncbi:MAG: hypothetical protein D6B25_06935 [Desulfobulbaceae bacterium]|nr:MAG: hypothetical protein D6B25_06935 [Desulfobulbaceae bacterium]